MAPILIFIILCDSKIFYGTQPYPLPV